MEIWYFETSAVNFFMEGHSVEDALATKQLQLSKGSIALRARRANARRCFGR